MDASTEKVEKAISVLQEINQLSEEAYTQLLEKEVGVEILAFFSEYARELDQSNEQFDLFMHLLITGYLVGARTGEKKEDRIISIS